MKLLALAEVTPPTTTLRGPVFAPTGTTTCIAAPPGKDLKVSIICPIEKKVGCPSETGTRDRDDGARLAVRGGKAGDRPGCSQT